MIASCIPTLQPLLELILGKRTLGSYSNGNSGRYKNSSNNFNTASFDHSKRSRKASKNDIAITGVESQESIIPQDQKGQDQKDFPMGAIRRTDNVTVEYESRSAHGPGRSQGSW